MEKLSISEKALPFIDALRKLIRTGAMASPSLESSCLLDMEIVKQHSRPGDSTSKRAPIFIAALRHVAQSRLEGKDSEVACMLFGFDAYAGMPIRDRYRAVAKLYNPYWTWENFRKEPLTRHLLAVYLALEREAELHTPLPTMQGRPNQAQTGLVGQDWVMEDFDGTYVFPSRQGEPLESMQVRRLRAISNDITVWRHYAYVRDRGTGSIPELSLFGHGSVRIIDTHLDSDTGMRTFITEVTFPKPIKYGETVEFTLIKRVNGNLDKFIREEGWDWFGLISLLSPAKHAKISLRFPPGKQPRQAWRYEDIVSGLVRPGSPSSDTKLQIDPSGYVSCAWNNLSAGYSYGISIDW